MNASKLIFAIVLAAAASSTFAATPQNMAANSQDSNVTRTHRWYQAGQIVMQEETERAKLEHEGFPQYSN